MFPLDKGTRGWCQSQLSPGATLEHEAIPLVPPPPLPPPGLPVSPSARVSSDISHFFMQVSYINNPRFLVFFVFEFSFGNEKKLKIYMYQGRAGVRGNGQGVRGTVPDDQLHVSASPVCVLVPSELVLGGELDDHGEPRHRLCSEPVESSQRQ